jgi:heat shock protein beta
MNFFLGMQAACRNNPDDPEALKALDVLFETAMISSGFSVGTVSC